MAQILTDEALETVMPGKRIARGVCRALAAHGYSVLTEFILRTGRRVDVMAMAGDGGLIAVEVKSSIEDFRSDSKWPDYLGFCDSFYFAVPVDFPQEILPGDVGLMVADPFGAEILRPAPLEKVAAARRKSLTLAFARTAARRLHAVEDPFVHEAQP